MGLIKQVDHAIDILKSKTNGLTKALFMFDNALSHLKHADNAISATRMVKCALIMLVYILIDGPQDPKALWTHHPNRPHMCDGINPLTGQPQSFYLPDNHPLYPGWFKGMEQIIYEHGL